MGDEQKFGWCFIGTGKLAGIVAKEIIASGRHKIVSVYTRRRESGEIFCEDYGGTYYESAADAITAKGVDGVYVVTPHRSHYEYARAALLNDKPVLCEKAFTVNYKDAKELIDIAREKKVYIAEAMWTWFSPVGLQVKKWLDNGEFGAVKDCLVDCRTNAQDYAPRVTDPAAAGGALLDMGVYATYYLYKLFGRPDSVTCTGDVRSGIDWSEEILFNYADGRTFKALASVNDEGADANMKLIGDKASINLPHLHYASHAEFIDSDNVRKEFDGNGSYINEFDIVASEIREGLVESRYVTHEDTLTIMSILDECRRQIGLKYDFE